MLSFDERIAAKFENVERVREDMHAYQSGIAYPHLRERPFSALFIDMGMGKTVTALSVVVDLLAEFTYDKVLIIGPLRVATETWPTEIGLWEHTAPYNFEVIHVSDDDPRLKAAREAARVMARMRGLSGSHVEKFAQKAETEEKERLRREAANSKSTIHIISRDWVDWLVNLHGRKWPYRCVIVDESSGFKDHKSNRFKALAKVRKAPGLIERLHLLTATPAPETYEHLFTQIYLLDRGERLGLCITHFRNRYFTQNKYTYKWELRPGAKEEITAKIADLCLVLNAADYLSVEKPVFIPRKVRLSDAQMKLYRTMERDFVVTLPNGAEVEAETAAALSQKLLQMASGVLYETYLDGDLETEDMKKVKRVHHLHDDKIDVLREIVEQSLDEPLMVAYHFKSSLDRLQKAFPQAVVMDREGKCVKRWNDRKIPILLIHPQSGGHGLNMQYGGHHLVFFDIPWSYENFFQLVGRLARQGQKHIVAVYLLLAAGTRDEDAWATLQQKGEGQDRFFDLLKRMIRKMLKARLKNEL